MRWHSSSQSTTTRPTSTPQNRFSMRLRSIKLDLQNYLVVVWPGMLPVPTTPGTLPAAPGALVPGLVAGMLAPLVPEPASFVAEPVPTAPLPLRGEAPDGAAPPPTAGPPLRVVWAFPGLTVPARSAATVTDTMILAVILSSSKPGRVRPRRTSPGLSAHQHLRGGRNPGPGLAAAISIRGGRLGTRGRAISGASVPKPMAEKVHVDVHDRRGE